MTIANAEHVPSDPPLIGSMLRHADTRPDEIAIICEEKALTWRQLQDAVLSMAGAITPFGETGDRVVLLGDVSEQLIVSYLAVIAAGRCAVPLQTSAHPDSLVGMIANAEPLIVLGDRQYLDPLTSRIADGVSLVRLDDPSSLEGFIAGSAPLNAAMDVPPETPFNIIYSSGTTGKAKGIVHSHGMRQRQTERSVFEIGPQSTMLLATPLYSNTTLMPTLMALYHGAKLVMMRKFNAEQYLDLAEEYQATHTMLVPVQYQRILDAGSFSRRNLGSFKVKPSTGAPIPRDDKRRIATEWPGRFVEVYGLTEGGCTCMLDVGAYPDKAHTVGKPAPGNEIRVIDENGNDMPTGTRSAMMMTGYFRNPQADAEFYWRDRDGTLYHRTGDIGMFDEDGFLILVDRKKDIIISGGFNIYASDIEDLLRAHDGIAEAAVIGIPSDRWGETPLAFVVAKPGAELDAEAIKGWVNERLGKTQRVSAVEIRTNLPRSALGKVLKPELRKPYWETANAAG